MVCRSVCQKEADDRGATRVLPFFLQQWTKLGLVFFLPVSLFFSFVRSALSTFFSFSILFLSRSIFLFVLTRCPLALLVSLFFTYFLLSFLLCCSSHSSLILSQFSAFLSLWYSSTPILLPCLPCPPFPHVLYPPLSSYLFTFVFSVSKCISILSTALICHKFNFYLNVLS